jgi:hypothetical protein
MECLWLVASEGISVKYILGLFDDDARTHFNAVKQVNNFVVHHADAARGNGPADAPRLGCSMDAVFGFAYI